MKVECTFTALVYWRMRGFLFLVTIDRLSVLENIGEIMFSDGVHLNFDEMKKCVRQPRGFLLSQSF